MSGNVRRPVRASAARASLRIQQSFASSRKRNRSPPHQDDESHHPAKKQRTVPRRCGARTKKGTQCKSFVHKHSSLHCYVHRSSPQVARLAQCSATTNEGRQCQNRYYVAMQHDRCRIHVVRPEQLSVEQLHGLLKELDSLKAHSCTSLKLIAEFGVGVRTCRRCQAM